MRVVVKAIKDFYQARDLHCIAIEKCKDLVRDRSELRSQEIVVLASRLQDLAKGGQSLFCLRLVERRCHLPVRDPSAHMKEGRLELRQSD